MHQCTIEDFFYVFQISMSVKKLKMIAYMVVLTQMEVTIVHAPLVRAVTVESMEVVVLI